MDTGVLIPARHAALLYRAMRISSEHLARPGMPGEILSQSAVLLENSSDLLLDLITHALGTEEASRLVDEVYFDSLRNFIGRPLDPQ